jgi:hypothetical protein
MNNSPGNFNFELGYNIILKSTEQKLAELY